jgi:hypothetical protein
MANPIAVDSNSMGMKTGGDVLLEPAVMTPVVVVPGTLGSRWSSVGRPFLPESQVKNDPLISMTTLSLIPSPFPFCLVLVCKTLYFRSCNENGMTSI